MPHCIVKGAPSPAAYVESFQPFKEVRADGTVIETRSAFLRHDGGAALVLTSEEFDDVRPCFDPAGRYLYFLSRRVYNPYRDELEHDVEDTARRRGCPDFRHESAGIRTAASHRRLARRLVVAAPNTNHETLDYHRPPSLGSAGPRSC